MNTGAVNSAAGVILAALTQNRTATGIALALDSAQMLMTPETAAETEQLRARVAELEAAHADAVDVSETLSRALHDEMLAGSALYAALTMPTTEQERQAALDRFTAVAQRTGQKHAPSEADGITRQTAPTQALREVPDGEHYAVVHHEHRIPHDLPPIGGATLQSENTVKCRCDEPGADPYACEADDCSGQFSELNPFGGGPVQGHDAKVSRTCGCGFRTTVWHVDDGSAEAELHGHVVRVHGGTYPQPETGGVR